MKTLFLNSEGTDLKVLFLKVMIKSRFYGKDFLSPQSMISSSVSTDQFVMSKLYISCALIIN